MRMKRWAALGLAAALALALCACGGGGAKPFQAEDTAKALLDSGAYTDTEDMVPPLAPQAIFDRLDAQTVTAGTVYASTYTAELAAVLEFTDEDAAQAGEKVLAEYVSAQTEAEKAYRPAEAEKLQNAVLERRGSTLALAVAADAPAARAALSAWGT